MRLFLFLCASLSAWMCLAQSGRVVIDDITLEGNKKTREAVIFRELDFAVGDTIDIVLLPDLLERNRQQVLNTGMFTAVLFNVNHWDDRRSRISIHISMRENWYLYPIPIFELADRNVNTWWQEHSHSLDRVNFGVRFYHLNISGRRDLLKLVAQYGYTQKYELDYKLPAFNRAQTLGIRTNWFFSRNKEVNYLTKANKQLFHRDEDQFLLRRLRFSAGLNYRPRLFFYHTLDVEFHQNAIDSLVVEELNPQFFLNQQSRQRYLALQYILSFDKRDIKPYPLRGHLLRVVVRKEGVGIFAERNSLTLTTTYAQYLPLGSRWSLELIGKAQVQAIRQRQAFYNNRALGYEADFLRGYELYVIDGIDFGYTKASLRYELINKAVSFGKAMPFEKLKVMPLRIFLSLNSDGGIANDPYYGSTNPLSNRMLWSAGLGLDIISYFDKVLQIQFSVNHLGEKGVFLHYKFLF